MTIYRYNFYKNNNTLNIQTLVLITVKTKYLKFDIKNNSY